MNTKTSLLTVSCIINKRKVPALFDTAADCSLVDPAMVKTLGLTHRINASVDYMLQGAFNGNKPSKAIGEIKLKFGIGTQVFQHTFVVSKLSSPTNVILGNDFWWGKDFIAHYHKGKAVLMLNQEKKTC